MKNTGYVLYLLAYKLQYLSSSFQRKSLEASYSFEQTKILRNLHKLFVKLFVGSTVGNTDS